MRRYNPSRLLCWFCAGGAVCAVAAADFSDTFEGRQVLAGDAAEVSGSNVNAQSEPGEPLHDNRPGGHPVWISWIATTNGVVTLSTAGSSFDTLLAVYTSAAGTNATLASLQPVAANDDSGRGLLTSQVQFGAQPGRRYDIAVDGFAGATGNVQLQLVFNPASAALPVVLRHEEDEALLPGDPLILTVDLEETDAAQLQWYYNDQPIPGATAPTLIITDLPTAQVGFYRLELTANGTSFSTTPIEIQFNSLGLSTVMARDKLADALVSGITAPTGGSGRSDDGGGDKTRKPRSVLTGTGGGLTRGYNGTQIFNTTYATSDPNEPHPCGQVGGASYWFAYQAPVSGMFHLDTAGSKFRTIIAVYTYTPPLLGYQSLIPVACNQAGTNGITVVEFPATAGTPYVVDIDGVKGARGLAYLNYWLAPSNLPPQDPPLITRGPLPQVVAVGNTIALDVAASGTPPFFYQWSKDGVTLPGQTNAALTLWIPSPVLSGAYAVSLSNALGAAVSAPAAVQIIARPLAELDPAAGALIVAFPGTRGYQFAIDSAPAVGSNTWTLTTTALTDGDGVVWLTNKLGPGPLQLFRLRRL